MGIASRTLSKAVLKSAGLDRLSNQHVRRQLKPCLEGYVVFWLAGAPPTVTHHDKNLSMRDGKPRIVDSAKLLAARKWYGQRIAERRDLIPLDPTHGIVARFEFRWPLPANPEKWPPLARPGGYCHQKPDLDNAKKAVLDVLVERGWLVDDSHVVKDGGSLKRWCWPHERPGVHIYLRSLARPYDSGATICLGPEEKFGELYPAPWTIAADAAEGGRAPFNLGLEARLTSVAGSTGVALHKVDQTFPPLYERGNGHASPASHAAAPGRTNRKRRGK